MEDLRAARVRKTELRARLSSARRDLSEQERRVAAAALATRVRDLPQVAAAGTIAAYVSTGAEPGTRDLIDALHATGVRVLLPVLMSDADLDWAAYHGSAALARTARGLLEPTGPRLGPEAVTAAQAVLLPGLAVDVHGIRLGRGGGSYDRVLARLERSGARPALAVLLYAHELVDAVPREPHDQPVDAAVTPEGVRRFPPPTG